MDLDIVRYRLHNQFLSHPDFTKPEQVVECLGAVQSQDYAGGKWALGIRMNGATDAAIDRAFNEGKILRTHILRPTWHFVSPQDIRWMLTLSAPRVHAVNGFMYRQQELDQVIIQKSYGVLESVLQGNKQLTRTELGSAFEKAGIKHAKGVRLGYFMMSAELDGIICSGARRGKQFTYALLEERAPKVQALERDEALAELTRRYFATRGPATLQDFTWWSGLTMAEARGGIELIKSQFVNEVFEDQTYWFANSVSPVKEKSPTAHLLPNYDEYFIGFKDRSAIGKVANLANVEANNPAFLAHIIIIDGQIVGGWKRALRKDVVLVELNLITKLTKAENQAVMAAIEQYGKFLGLPAKLANVD
jgi:winged helix DNA-binding protein